MVSRFVGEDEKFLFAFGNLFFWGQQNQKYLGCFHGWLYFRSLLIWGLQQVGMMSLAEQKGGWCLEEAVADRIAYCGSVGVFL